MDDLIKALEIFSKYCQENNKIYPTNCEKGELYILIDPDEVTFDDIGKLIDLGFYPFYFDNEKYFVSYRFGNGFNCK